MIDSAAPYGFDSIVGKAHFSPGGFAAAMDSPTPASSPSAPVSEEAATRLERIKAGIQEAKRKMRDEEKERIKRRKLEMEAKPDPLDDLYAGLPAPDPVKDQALAERRKADQDDKKRLRLPTLPSPDLSKVIFLDIDGVMRPMSAGGYRSIMVDGELTLEADTSDFMASAMLALRHVVQHTGAVLVLSSEWRRNAPMRAGVNGILAEYEMPGCVTWTPTDLERELGTDDPFQTFVERRAREISLWLRGNPQVCEWVVLDDINMSSADEDRKPTTLRMTERIVQTHHKIGLTLDNAKAAVRILSGEKLPPQILEVQPCVGLV